MSTTDNPPGDQPGDDAHGGGEPLDEYGYSGGYGYGPGYGDPDGGAGAGYGYGPVYRDPDGGAGAGYGYGSGYRDPDGGAGAEYGYGSAYGEGPAPGYGEGDGPGYADPGAGTPALPVVAATPALRGYPGGPGLPPPADDSGSPSGPDARVLNGPSVWQSAQKAWRDSGVDWQRPSGDPEPAEAEWERAAAAPPGKRSAAGTAPPRAGRVSARSLDGLSGSLAGPSGSLAGPGAAGRARDRGFGETFRARRGLWLLLVIVVVVAALVAGGLVLFGGGRKAASGPQYPPAVPAGADLTAHPGQLGRGVFQSVTGVAAAAGTVVAVGSEIGPWLPRAQFLVSADGGRSWRLAAVRTAGGGPPSPVLLPQRVAGGPGGWLAVGAGASWTSPDGRTWTLHPGSFPVQAGDQVAALAATGKGFIAVGDNVSAGHPALRSPVMWTSANGLTWQRLGASRLGLPAPGGRVLRISGIAAHSGAVLVYGSMLTTVRNGKRSVTAVRTGLWQSGDGGSAWALASLPAAAGPAGTVDGVAATGTGFVAIRPGTGKAAGPDAVAYTSPNGISWTQGGTITTARPAGLRITLVGGSGQGVVAAGLLSSGAPVAYESPDGGSWHAVAGLGPPGQALAGVTVTTGGTVVAGGGSPPGPLGQAPYLALAGAGRATSQVSFAAIPGATEPALAVNDIAVAGGRQVAVGTADGRPAIWSAPSVPGVSQHWVAAGSAALNRPGLSTLGGLAHGSAGWLAVGGTVNGTSITPVVVVSANGTRWQAADSEPAFAAPGITLHAAAAGRAGYVSVGQQVVPATTTTKTTGTGRHKTVSTHVVPAHTIAAAWWSAGLTGWTRAAGLGAFGPGARQMAAVTGYRSGFVAVGSMGKYPAAWTSANGRTWQLIQLGPPPGASAATLQQVAVRGNLIVATGTQTKPSGTAPFAEYTTDGGTLWQQEPLTVPAGPAAVTGLTAAGKGFVAVGTVGPPGHQRVVVWWSATGYAWKTIEPRGTGLTSPGSQAITALTARGTALIGAGYLVTAAGDEQPTLWNATAGP